MATLQPPAVAAPPPAVKGLHKVRLASMFASDPMEKKGPEGASRTRVNWKKCLTKVPLYQMLRGTPSSGDIAANEARDECEVPPLSFAIDGKTSGGAEWGRWGVGISQTSGGAKGPPCGWYAGGPCSTAPLLLDIGGSPSIQSAELLAKIAAVEVIEEVAQVYGSSSHLGAKPLRVVICTDTIANVRTLMKCARRERGIKVGTGFLQLLKVFATALVRLLRTLQAMKATLTFIHKSNPHSGQATVHPTNWMPDVLAKLGMDDCNVEQAHILDECDDRAFDQLRFTDATWKTPKLLWAVTISLEGDHLAPDRSIPSRVARGKWRRCQDAYGYWWRNDSTEEYFYEASGRGNGSRCWTKYRYDAKNPTKCWWCATNADGVVRDFFFERTGDESPPTGYNECSR